MQEEEFLMIIAIVFIGCAAGVAHAALGVLKGFLDRRLKLEELKLRNNEAALTDVLRTAREEMSQLHRASTDVILTFDSTLQRLDQRIQSLERQSLPPGGDTSVAVATPMVASAAVSTNGAMPAAEVRIAPSDGAAFDR